MEQARWYIQSRLSETEMSVAFVYLCFVEVEVSILRQGFSQHGNGFKERWGVFAHVDLSLPGETVSLADSSWTIISHETLLFFMF